MPVWTDVLEELCRIHFYWGGLQRDLKIPSWQWIFNPIILESFFKRSYLDAIKLILTMKVKKKPGELDL
jgi:hypothetical protein